MVKEKLLAKTVEPVTHLDDVLPMEKKCHNCGVEGHYKALCRSCKQSRTVSRMDKEEEDLNMKLNKMKARMTGHFP